MRASTVVNATLLEESVLVIVLLCFIYITIILERPL